LGIAEIVTGEAARSRAQLLHRDVGEKRVRGPGFQPSKTFPMEGRADAEAWLHQMEADKLRGRIAVEQSGELLVGELFHHWREHGWDDPDVGLSEKTQALYADWWNRYCAMDRPFVGLPLSQAGSREINQFRRRVQQKVKAKLSG
jgi:hypothetical protein